MRRRTARSPLVDQRQHRNSCRAKAREVVASMRAECAKPHVYQRTMTSGFAQSGSDPGPLPPSPLARFATMTDADLDEYRRTPGVVPVPTG